MQTVSNEEAANYLRVHIIRLAALEADAMQAALRLRADNEQGRIPGITFIQMHDQLSTTVASVRRAWYLAARDYADLRSIARPTGMGYGSGSWLDAAAQPH